MAGGVSAAFYALALGTPRKYSCCLWPKDVTTQNDAEFAANPFFPGRRRA